MAPEEQAGGREAARPTLIEEYLSVWHRDHPGEGCPVSGFAADLGHEPGQAARATRGNPLSEELLQAARTA
ncbi:hypothetical protein ACFXI6_12000 [Streptomyces mirabilis]|uniref:hypothetical protein n=1 Tax=Streptomyces mirabilis TaxID=68239 RepID=UPI0036D1B55E